MPPGEHLLHISEVVVGICLKSATYPVMSTDLRVSVIPDVFELKYDRLSPRTIFESHLYNVVCSKTAGYGMY